MCLLTLPLLLWACADDPATVGSGDETPPALDGVALHVSCGTVRFPDLPPDPSRFPALGEEREEFDLEGVDPLDSEFLDRYDWSVADRSDDQLVLFGQPLSDGEANGQSGYADFERRDGRWVPTGWGGCRMEVKADGWGNARFVLDPVVEPDPGSDRLRVRATENACASGQPPGTREVRSVIVAKDDQSVSIAVLVELTRASFVTCPGNPSFAYEVDLGSALDDREVLDASVHPPLRRPWPATQSSVTSGGLEE